MAEQVAEYEIGRRHLANIMGEDPETFTQEDIDVSFGVTVARRTKGGSSKELYGLEKGYCQFYALV